MIRLFFHIHILIHLRWMRMRMRMRMRKKSVRAVLACFRLLIPRFYIRILSHLHHRSAVLPCRSNPADVLASALTLPLFMLKRAYSNSFSGIAISILLPPSLRKLGS